MLELRNLTKRFSGIPAVDNVSFQASPGAVTGYLGPNGSGKSTTVKMITSTVTSGRSNVSSPADPAAAGAERRGIGTP